MLDQISPTIVRQVARAVKAQADEARVKAALVGDGDVLTYLEASADEVATLNARLGCEGLPADWLYVTADDLIASIVPSRTSAGYRYLVFVRGSDITLDVDREVFYEVVRFFGLGRDDMGYDTRYMLRHTCDCYPCATQRHVCRNGGN